MTDQIDDLERRRYRPVFMSMQLYSARVKITKSISIDIRHHLQVERRSIDQSRPPLTLVDRLGGDQDVTFDERSSPEDGPALSHIPQILDQFPHARVGDGDILDVDGEEREPGSLKQVRGVPGIWE